MISQILDLDSDSDYERNYSPKEPLEQWYWLESFLNVSSK